MDIDQVRLNFSPQSLQMLNIVVAVIMFGVALDIQPKDFKEVMRSPKAPLIGLACQFFLLPCLAFLLTLVLNLQPSIALGLILVAACPGGNFSNFLTHFSGGNTALSVMMSSVSTVLSIVMTPLNISLWGQLNPRTAPLIKSISMDPADILQTVSLILLLPLVLGMAVQLRWPALALRLKKPFQTFSLIFLVTVIVIALSNNIDYFFKYIGLAAGVVMLANGAGLGFGYLVSRKLGLTVADARAVAFEVGIQNAGFGLILVFNFFNGLGGMAIVAAWWGVWHLISGLALAIYWRRLDAKSGPAILDTAV